MRAYVHKILSHLVDVSLLLEGEQMRYVLMSDFHRHVALYISSKDPNSDFRTYVDNGQDDEALRSKSWQHAKWVSMINSKRDSLPENSICEGLETLMLQKNKSLVQILEAHFGGMCKLLVLNLYDTDIKELPPLSGLSQLKALYLNCCSFLKIDSQETIQPLQHLEVLDTRGTKVNFLPCLKSLLCLRISYTETINYDGISELHELEELIIEVKSLLKCPKVAENIIAKVASLEKLTTFICSFPSLEALAKFLEARRGDKTFTSFQFFVGCENSKHPKIIEAFNNRISKYIRYCDGNEKDALAITKTLPHAEAFEVIFHKSVRTLWELAQKSNLERLYGLLIEECNQMTTIVERDMVHHAINHSEGLLPSLEQLHLDNLQHLNIVFRGPLHPRSFSMLHTLTLKNCPELTRIFFATTVDDLRELQKLQVQNCQSIEVLIWVKKVTEREQSMFFPKLRELILDDLSKLESICPNEVVAWHSLEHLKVQKCRNLKALPFNKANAGKLIAIEGQREWWKNLVWNPPEAREGLEYAFSAST